MCDIIPERNFIRHGNPEDREMENGEKKKERKGLSLRTTSTLLMIVSLLITIGLVVAGIRTFNSFRDMKKATED